MVGSASHAGSEHGSPGMGHESGKEKRLRHLTIVSFALLALAGSAVAASPAKQTPYAGRAAALLTSTPEGFNKYRASTTSITPGAKAGLRAQTGADYVGVRACSSTNPNPCGVIALRVLVFKTPQAALAHWKVACPGCDYRRDRDDRWQYKFTIEPSDRAQPISVDNGSKLTMVALCTNLVIATKAINWGKDEAQSTFKDVIAAAEAGGMSSCNPLKKEPGSNVFARGTAQDRGKAVAVGSITNPRLIQLRIQTNTHGSLYVEWTLTCTNGTRSETTSDQGVAHAPLTITLPIGIPGATKCSASASAVSNLRSIMRRAGRPRRTAEWRLVSSDFRRPAATEAQS